MLVLCVLFSLIAPLLGGQYKTVQDYSQPEEPSCGLNEHYVCNTNLCQKTCGNREMYNVMGPCVPYSACVCDQGYMRLYDDSTGPCVKEDQCPCDSEEMEGCNGDPNASFSECPYYEPPSCEYPDPEDCSPDCAPPGCECNYGYVLSCKGKCVKWEQCPSCYGDTNATYTDCLSNCPPSCDNRAPVCTAKCNYSGCQCRKGYIQSKNGCILPQDCPVKHACKDPNSSYSDCPSACPATCDNPKPEKCIKKCNPKGCQCNPGYVLFKDKCILPKNCPVQGCNGDPNATKKSCPNPCPATCDNLNPSKICTKMCLSEGCECNPGYVMSNGKCIKPQNCPACNGDPNAVFKTCPSICPPTCDDPNRAPCYSKKCQPDGCECKPGYVLSNGKCVLLKNCPVKDPCLSKCTPTCAVPNPSGCEYSTGKQCCGSGFILSKIGGKCIPVGECPKGAGCNGDPNAVVKQCPKPCPTSCRYPDPLPCKKNCMSVGCECAYGYLQADNGTCVKPEQCPGGVNCPPNESYSFCKVGCPNNYCPVDDSLGQIACDPPYPCPSGCVCNTGFLRKSKNDLACIEASKCPPVKCTRDHEEYRPSLPNCYTESCRDANQPQPPCDKPYRDYRPRCACKKGFYRNDSLICVPANQCPGYCPIAKQCRPTCAVPNPANCPAAEPCTTNDDGCQCQEGYILSEAGGKCIKIEQCPQNQGCNGDQNAVVKACPWSCPATCDSPNASQCKKCLPAGCECQPGYILSKENGKCILPDKCPGGNPCGVNGTFVDCAFRCPNQVCPNRDSDIQIACKPGRPCPPGCACKPGYKRLSDKNDKCVLEKDCPGYCPIAKQCRPTCAVPNPANCPAAEPCTTNDDGCQCQEGYILSEAGGKCIKIEQCPQNQGCNGDQNAVVKACPWSCPATCDSPNASQCKKCLPVGCECQPGYILSKENGKCILPDKCPGGNPCGVNGTFVDCAFRCPNQVCPKRDSDIQTACKPGWPCPPGCACKPGYKRLSDKNDKCVLEKDCPGYCPIPKKCRPTCAVPNPANCPAAEPCTTNDDGCQCQEGYILSEAGGKCIKIEQCPQNQGCNGDQNAVVKACPWSCPATCDSPNASQCKKCLPVGCECQPGYILSKENGKCILPDKCPGGNPCGVNGTFVDCAFRCPNQVCPKRDSDIQTACKPGWPCPPGCACKPDYKRLSDKNDKCVLEKDCPGYCPIAKKCRPTCAVPNPANCPAAEPCTTNDDGCQCQEGYILSEAGGKCIKIDQCPQNQGCNGDQYAVVKACPWSCPATCDSPNASQCKKCLPAGCECQPGYILTKENGKCILPDKCPGGNPCGVNGTFVDCAFRCPNQVCPKRDSDIQTACKPGRPCPPGCACKPGYKRLSDKNDKCVLEKDCPGYCPIPKKCRPTCAVPNPANCPAAEPCTTNDDGCQCQEGYILSEAGGKCIKIEQCPQNQGCNGDQNAVVKACPWSCPATCDSPNASQCKKCLPVGCECQPGYILSKENGKCILPDKCPGGNPCGVNGTFVDCAFRCPNQVCPKRDSDIQTACKPGWPCPPGCACKPGYKRLSDKNDKCVLEKDCPGYCPIPKKCRPTCAVPNPANCPAAEPCTTNDDGCQCQEGYILSEAGGKCIKIEQCPQNQGCNGDQNAVVKACPWSCPATCDSPNASQCKKCLPVGCECQPGYILSKENGKCILPDKCPGGNPCGVNGTFVDCAFRCPNQVCPKRDSDIQTACKPGWPCPPGCACKPGYKRLSDKNDKCVLEKDCPGYCPIPKKCRPTCAVPNPANCPAAEPCTTNDDGCQCQEGYILSEAGGKCIKIEQCPQNQGCNGDQNAVVKACPWSCPATCDSPNASQCKKCLPVGCECQPGYILSKENGKCILPDKCPGGNPCGVNGTFVDCAFRCPNQVCPKRDSDIQTACKPGRPCPPGCACKPGYKRLSDKNDKCVLEKDCPGYCPIPRKCRPTCAVPNPANCPAAEPCTTNDDGCQCQEGYILSEAGGKCIKIEECPQNQGCNGDQNAVVKACPWSCPATCDSPNASQCKKCLPVGCECQPGYIFSKEKGKCILPENCPGGNPCGSNGTFVNCASHCPNQNCPKRGMKYQVACKPAHPCPPGCACKPGYKRLGSKGNICVLATDCPGYCPIARRCRPTCAVPNPSKCPVAKPATTNDDGCQCQKGYILSNSDGKCIKIEECPQNQGCNGDMNAVVKACPWSKPATCDSPNASQSKECLPAGCECKPGYIFSKNKGKCVLPDNCPGGNPCGVNGTFVDCAFRCPNQNCPIDDSTQVACKPGNPCPPGCACKPGYKRLNKDSDKCILSTDCHTNKCTPTCAVPNPKNCVYAGKPCCGKGFILSKIGGKCIPVEDCPRDCGCNGDPNAVVKQCPAPCPSTCRSPNATPCKKACQPLGCECASGYLQDDNGKCVKPEQCPGGYPCRKNEIFVPCKNSCPTDYCPVDDSRAKVICETSPFAPCYSGCVCKLNHKRKSRKDDRCIVSSDCPVVNCTRKNECWSSCPSACLKESCHDVGKKRTVCNTLVLNCEPRCICSKGYYRNSKGVCVCPKECGKTFLNPKIIFNYEH